MEFQQLRYLCAIADTGSFSRAAEHCHVAQPSLSQQISKLEDELGTKLFDRLGRSIRLTDAGRTFLPHARSVLHQTELARNEVDGGRRDARGTVTVGVIPTIAPYYMPALSQPSRGSFRNRVCASSKRPRPYSWKACAISPSTSRFCRCH